MHVVSLHHRYSGLCLQCGGRLFPITLKLISTSPKPYYMHLTLSGTPKLHRAQEALAFGVDAAIAANSAYSELGLRIVVAWCQLVLSLVFLPAFFLTILALMVCAMLVVLNFIQNDLV